MRFSFVCTRLAVCLLAICHLSSCSKPADPIAAANVFFGRLKEGKSGEAYDSTAFAFQAQQTVSDFAATARQQGFQNLEKLIWTRKEVTGDEAALEGDLVTEGEVTKHVKAKFIREGGAWKLFKLWVSGGKQVLPQNPFSLFGRNTGFAGVAHPPLPDEATLKQLAGDALLKFNDAVVRVDFHDFYESLSRAWRDQLTERRLAEAFHPFVDAHVSFSEIGSLEPAFDVEPRIDPDGLLILNGSYQLKNCRLIFQLKFVYELPAWKLFGIDANLVQ